MRDNVCFGVDDVVKSGLLGSSAVASSPPPKSESV